MTISKFCPSCKSQHLFLLGRMIICEICGYYTVEDGWQKRKRIKERNYFRYRLTKKT